MRLRKLLLSGLVLTLTVSLGAQAARYVPPPVGRLMLDEVLPVTVTAGTALPLYLEKTGRYYAELYVETAETGPDAEPAPATTAVPLSFSFVFKRGKRVLREEAVDVVLAPGEHHKTLFWLESPAHLPARRDLQMTVSLRELPPALADKALRLQITRKFEMRPLAPP